MEKHILVGSCDSEGGVIGFALNDSGKLRLTSLTPLDRPMYLCKDGDTLYALLREPFMQQSGVAELKIDPDGTVSQQGEIIPTHGSISCHILKFAGQVYTANYLSGSVTCLPDKLLAFGGKGPKKQQDCSHPHCLTPTPDGKYICICDLGADCIYVCTPELAEVSRVKVKEGSGPRHLIFSRDGRLAYCADELSSEVSVFSYEDGKLTFITSEGCVPDDFEGDNAPSAIRLNEDGTELYVANRGHNSVCIWHVEGEKLSERRFISSGGELPREMNVIGGWVLCGNNDCLTVTSAKTGEQTDSFRLEKPWCILSLE